MPKEYDEEDFLLLSGIQHFAFCRRQWALAYIEMQWNENLRTVEGHILHEKAHDGFSSEKRGDVITSRGMPIFSRTLGANGVCDIVELRLDENGITLAGREGRYLPVPVEYKRGKPKEGDEDTLQLAAQAICLEEMLLCSVPYGYLYYGETNHRTRVEIDGVLRTKVYAAFTEMHELYERRYTPRVKPTKACNACSLRDLCLPKLLKVVSAGDYLKNRIEEVTL